MTVLEMHIGIDLILQEINSNVISNIGDQEKDFLLNHEYIRWINQKIRAASNEKGIGFQKDIKRYEEVKALLKTKSISVYARDSESLMAFLPSDCLRLIKDRSITKDLCGAAYAPTTAADAIHTLSYKFLNSGVNNYQAFVYKLDGVIIFQTADYPQFSTGIAAAEMKFELIPFMVEKIRDAGYEVKYENFRGKNVLESLIIYKVGAFTQTVIYNAGTPVVVASTAWNTYNRVTAPVGTKEVDNELLPTHLYRAYLNSAHGGTVAEAPISTLDGDKINIFHKQKFIVSSLNIDYIRIPRRISLPLNQSCDVDEQFHQEIMDNLARRLAAITNNQQYQQLFRENLLKE